MLSPYLLRLKHAYILVFALLLLTTFYFFQLNDSVGSLESWKRETEGALAATKYLINTKNCKIPDIEAFNVDTEPYFRKEERMNCSKFELLSIIDKVGDDVYLKIRRQVKALYSEQDFSCCYANISRGSGDSIDYSLSYSDCVPFASSIKITSDLIKVVCKSPSDALIYENVHPIIKKTAKNAKKPSKDGYSLLVLGVDSMSRLNFQRTLPKTLQLLQTHNWIDVQAYNKINDNTFTNMMAALTGMEKQQINEVCAPDTRTLDACPLIFRRFNDNGFVTATAEDESYLSTFHYFTAGFRRPPTDLYFRAYFLAAETLKVVTRYLASFCTGPVSSGERMLQLATDFMDEFRGSLKFGYFWSTTFSHNNLNLASAMDDALADFFSNLICGQLLNRTIVVFYSDHGFRFGKMRYTYTGSLEERLPFNFVRLPDELKRERPEMYANFVANAKNSLATPYDLYMTFQDVIRLSNPAAQVAPSMACPKCRSLFEKMDANRSCGDAGVPEHFCACLGHFYTSRRSPIVRQATEFALNRLNGVIGGIGDGGAKCEHYDLKDTISAGITETFYNERNESSNFLRVIFETFPKGAFEASVKVMHLGEALNFELEGDISRVDRYGDTSSCVKDRLLRKYCHCKSAYVMVKKTVDILFNS